MEYDTIRNGTNGHGGYAQRIYREPEIKIPSQLALQDLTAVERGMVIRERQVQPNVPRLTRLRDPIMTGVGSSDPRILSPRHVR